MQYEEKILHINGCNKEYIISNYGTIYDPATHKYRKLKRHHKGYLKCSFIINGKYKSKFVHRLVLMTFNPVDDMEKLQVDHIDGNKENNRLDNLEWVTNSENTRRAIEKGLWDNCFPSGNKSHHHKLSEEEVSHIKYYLLQKYSYDKIAEMFNISKSTIAQIAKGKTWKNIEPKNISVESSTTR